MPRAHRMFHIHTCSFPRFENVPDLPFLTSATQNTCRYAHIASTIQVLSMDELVVTRTPKTVLRLDPVLFEALLESIQSPPDQILWWREALEAGHRDAWFSLLLLQLSNLRKLELKYMETRSPYLQCILSRLIDPNDPLTGLTALSELEIGSHLPVEDVHLSSVIPFAQLPSVRKIRLVGAIGYYPLLTSAEGNETHWANEITSSLILPSSQSPSKITHLAIHGCSTLATLPNLLASLPKLQSFIYCQDVSGIPQDYDQLTGDRDEDAGINSNADAISSIDILNAAALYPGLARASADSLQELWVTVVRPFRKNDNEQRDQEILGTPIGELRVFSALTQVWIPVDNLLTVVRRRGKLQNGTIEEVWVKNNLWDVLPLSLEKLFLEDCDRGILPVIVSQLRQVLKSQQPFDEVDRVPLVCPVNTPRFSLEMMMLECGHRMAMNDIQPEVYADLMDLAERFTMFDLTLKVLDK
ncbi:hypothetical protein AbraIFM66951_003939 [Aspergillus brasiliensis]|uniref:F-box domain-containing protein n=1 Tax=Aspergillus brasiliensis TaxID=319629 RepID=A0A9W5Z1W3_9EURO|nr:hypothetical protein AbraCBS73388_003518 [Aspergillus brasiliensis]GKZ50675.1 hypothetical protein AbraIFM66951_003939 [Aspergillus brasiliensis]